MTHTDSIPGAGAGGDTSVGVGLVGAGAIGAFHGESLAWRVPGVRLAGVAAPARFHADLVVAAAGAGKAVFCEKPMALTLADADRALAAVEASFNAVYGHDIRGEVFGSAGMVTAGDQRRTTMAYYGAEGMAGDTWRRNIDLFHDAYTAELAAIRSADTGRPVRLEEVEQPAY